MARMSTEELSAAKAGRVGETSHNKNIGGVYVLKTIEDGQEVVVDRVVAKNDPRSSGSVQADAAVRMGYVFERFMQPSDINPELIPDEVVSKGSDLVPKAELDALKERLAALETAKPAPVSPAVKPLSMWNKTQLMAKISELGLTAADDLTNKQLVEIIKGAGL